MAATTTVSPLLHTLPLHRARYASAAFSPARASNPAPSSLSTARAIPGRREVLFLLTTTGAVTAGERASRAEDIPLFGLRRKLKKAEQEAEEIVKEGFEAAEKGIETAERGIETAERGIETAEKEIETAVSFGGLAQAGVVAGAEFLGVVVASLVVNGILGPEAQKS